MTSNYDIFDLNDTIDDLIDMTDGDVDKIDKIVNNVDYLDVCGFDKSKELESLHKEEENDDENEIPLF